MTQRPATNRTEVVLTINGGSSSIKFALFEPGEPPGRVLSGQIERVGLPDATYTSHVSPECPGSMHEGGELGYSLSHAFGAAFDDPDLVVACVLGDGEAETGPLATAA